MAQDVAQIAYDLMNVSQGQLKTHWDSNKKATFLFLEICYALCKRVFVLFCLLKKYLVRFQNFAPECSHQLSTTFTQANTIIDA